MNSHWQDSGNPMTCPPRSRWPSPTLSAREVPRHSHRGARGARPVRAEDFRVRTLTDTEPEATPLGPFAVVDVLKGTAPTLAAVRQGCGYYDVVQDWPGCTRRRPPAPAPRPEVPSFAIPAAPQPCWPPCHRRPRRHPERAAKSRGETVQERITPQAHRPGAPPEPTRRPRPPASPSATCPSPAGASPAWMLPRRATRS